MLQELIKNITTENGENEFQVRFLKEDGVGLLTSKNDQNYLILDSLDYWYDVIQTEYPKKKKCSCKNEWFNVQFIYIPRSEAGEIRAIKIITTCANCGKTSKPFLIEIDYSPTDDLILKPLTFCEKPNIRYKFSELTSYWSGDNLKDFLDFVFFDLKLNVYCWFLKRPENIRFFDKINYEKAIEIITQNHEFFDFYFTDENLVLSEYINFKNERGIFLKLDIWRKSEIIELSSPTHIVGYGLLYYINYCNQYIDKGEVKNKSKNFENSTIQLKNWLQNKFITKRGTNCYDGKEAYDRFIAKNFPFAPKNPSSTGNTASV